MDRTTARVPSTPKGCSRVAVGIAHGYRPPSIHTTLYGSHAFAAKDDPFRVGLSWVRLFRGRRRACPRLLQSRPSALRAHFADLSFIDANRSSTQDATLQNRSDINADTYVDYADIANAFMFGAFSIIV